MTSLDDRYRLLKCVALGGGIRTHNAQESSTGRPVMVHILDGAEPEMVERIQAQVAALPAPDRSRITEITTTDVGLVIVSEILSGLKSFPDWLDARASVIAPAPQAPPEAQAPPPPAKPTESFAIGKIDSSDSRAPKAAQPPGEFTSLFQSHEPATPQPKAQPIAPPPPPPIPTPAPVAAPVVPAPVAAPAPPPPASLKPGEFTSLFQPVAPPPPQHATPSPVMGAPARSAPPPFQPSPPPPPLPLGASSSSVFATPVQPARPHEPAFGPLGSLGGPVLGSPAAAPLPSPSPLTAPPAPVAPPASPLAEPPRSPLATGGLGGAPLPPVIAPPVFTSPAAVGNASPMARSPLADQRAAGPSDYTMLIRQSETPAPPMPKPNAAAPAQPPATRRSIPLGLIIALNVVLVLAIALVLYFVFRPAPPAAVPGSTGAVPTVPGVKAPTVKAPTVTAPTVTAPTVTPPAVKP